MRPDLPTFGAALALSLMLGAFGAPAQAAECAAPSIQHSAEAAARINRMRQGAGLPPVAPDPALTAAAARQACDMARRGRLSHQGGGGVSARVRSAGYPAALAAENIAAGQMDADSAMGSWAGSSGHRANLLHRRVRHVGIGQAVGPDGRTRFWSLVLAAPR